MSNFNEWFSSLPRERQEVLREDKWMLANAAFEHEQAELKEAKSVIREIAAMGHDSTDKEIADEALRIARAWVANQP